MWGSNRRHDSQFVTLAAPEQVAAIMIAVTLRADFVQHVGRKLNLYGTCRRRPTAIQDCTHLGSTEIVVPVRAISQVTEVSTTLLPIILKFPDNTRAIASL